MLWRGTAVAVFVHFPVSEAVHPKLLSTVSAIAAFIVPYCLFDLSGIIRPLSASSLHFGTGAARFLAPFLV